MKSYRLPYPPPPPHPLHSYSNPDPLPPPHVKPLVNPKELINPRHGCQTIQVCGHAAEDISNYKELFPSIFTARALTNCDMFTLDAEEFHQVVQEYPKVQVKLHAWAVR